MSYTDREAWLLAAYQLVIPVFKAAGHPLPPVEQIKISTGFGLAKGENKSILGQTISPVVSADDKTWTVFVSPVIATGEDALHVIFHEAVHVAVGTQEGHGKVFAEAGRDVGLDGRPTVMTPGTALSAEIMLMELELGPYPHVALDLGKLKAPVPAGGTEPGTTRTRVTTGPAVQTSRHLKTVCMTEGCPTQGYLARVSQKWLAVSAPLCPGCSKPMRIS